MENKNLDTIIEKIMIAEEQIARGEGREAEEVFEEWRNKYRD